MEIAAFFQQYPHLAIAFSGGVDSAVLLALARKHGARVKAYYVKSQFQPLFELEDARQVARQLQVELKVIEADVLSVPAIAANPPDRCYYCKRHIFSLIAAHAARDGFTAIADGTNASDDVASRPGFRALQELQVLSPLRACGITKAQIRHLAQQAGLPLADKPAYACLATRIPTGNPISAPVLALTERSEARMRALGFRNFRVRYLGGDAKLELSRSDFSVFYRRRDALYAALSEDYRHIYLDLKERADE